MPIMLLVNKQLVPLCRCGKRTSSHWRYADIAAMLGRDMVAADALDFTIIVDPIDDKLMP
jgi:hypothetical protein